MKLGSKINLFLISLVIFHKFSFAEEKITTSPLLNIDEIKPSFEELDAEVENFSSNQNLKEKKKFKKLKIFASYFDRS